LEAVHDNITDALLTGPFQELRDLSASLEQASEAPITDVRPAPRALASVGARWAQDGKVPAFSGKAGTVDGGSIRTEMMERTWRRTNHGAMAAPALAVV
jgi:hypothetical protein